MVCKDTIMIYGHMPSPSFLLSCFTHLDVFDESYFVLFLRALQGQV